MRIEETKINFFDPSAYRRNGGDNLYQIEKEEDE